MFLVLEVPLLTKRSSSISFSIATYSSCAEFFILCTFLLFDSLMVGGEIVIDDDES